MYLGIDKVQCTYMYMYGHVCIYSPCNTNMYIHVLSLPPPPQSGAPPPPAGTGGSTEGDEQQQQLVGDSDATGFGLGVVSQGLCVRCLVCCFSFVVLLLFCCFIALDLHQFAPHPLQAPSSVKQAVSPVAASRKSKAAAAASKLKRGDTKPRSVRGEGAEEEL